MTYSEYLRHIKALAETSTNPWLCLEASRCPATSGSDNHTRFTKDIRRALGPATFLPTALVRDGLIKPFEVPPGVDGSPERVAALLNWQKQARLDWLDGMIAAAEMPTMPPSVKS